MFFMKPNVQAFFDPATWTVTYVIHDGSACAIVDSVLDYDPKSGRTSSGSADKVVDFVPRRGLKIEWILETHAHADHLSAAYRCSSCAVGTSRTTPTRREEDALQRWPG